MFLNHFDIKTHFHLYLLCVPDISYENEPAPKTYSDQQHPSQLLTKLAELRESTEYCDIIFKVDDKTFLAHKVIMAASSDYFSAIFAGGFKERSMDTIPLKGITPEAFQQIISHIYTANICLDTSNVQDIYEAANLLQYGTIQDECENHIKESMCPDTCIDYLLTAKKHSLMEIYQIAETCLLKKFKEVSEKANVKNLPYELIPILLKGQDLLGTEQVVVESVCTWLTNHPEVSREQRKELVKCTRYALLDHDDLEIIKMKEEILGANNVLELKENHLDYTLDLIRRPVKSSPFSMRRGPTCLVVVGGVDSNKVIQKSMTVIPPDTRNGNVREEQFDIPSPSPRTETAVVTIGNFLFLIGGKGEILKDGEHQVNDTVHQFDILNKTWTEMAPMNVGRYQHSAAVKEDTILVIGGVDVNGAVISSVEKYHVSQNRWSKLNDFPHPVCGAAASECKGQVYVSGGQNGYNQSYSAIYCHDNHRDVWLFKAKMSTRRFNFIQCSSERYIYQIGGDDYNYENDICTYSFCDKVYIHNMRNRSQLKDIPLCLALVGGACYKDWIYLLGGYEARVDFYNNDQYWMQHKSILRYSIEHNDWYEENTTLPTPLAYCAGTLLVVPHHYFSGKVNNQ